MQLRVEVVSTLLCAFFLMTLMAAGLLRDGRRLPPRDSPASAFVGHRPVLAASSQDEIHVFTTACGDSEVVVLNTLRLITSVYESSTSLDPPRRVHLHITHDDAISIRTMLSSQLRGFDERRLRVTSSVTAIPNDLLMSFKKCSTARLMLAEEHPDVDVGLYLDADTYVNHDLHELVALAGEFRGAQWCGMVQEAEGPFGYYVDSPGRYEELHMRWYRPFGLNAGVLLFSLNGWRATNFTSFALAFKPPPRGCCGDQDTFNVYLEEHRDEVYLLPCKWNTRTDNGCGCCNTREVPSATNGLPHPPRHWQKPYGLPQRLSEAGVIHGNRGAFPKWPSFTRYLFGKFLVETDPNCGGGGGGRSDGARVPQYEQYKVWCGAKHLTPLGQTRFESQFRRGMKAWSKAGLQCSWTA